MSEPVPMDDERLAYVRTLHKECVGDPSTPACDIPALLARLDAERERAGWADQLLQREITRRKKYRAERDAERDARIAAEAKAERLGKDKHRLAVDRINVERERDAALARAVFDTEGDLLAQLGALRVENDRLRARSRP